MNKAVGFLVCAGAWGLAATASAKAPLERIEPPNWWVGMKSGQLMLMMHGDHLADFTPSIDYPGVRLESVTRSDNPNYLFLNLQIAAQTQAGVMPITLQAKHGQEQRYTVRYTLLAREAHSADRPSFTSADVILNLMPDRYANGDASNDNLPGYLDRADRSNDAAGRHGGDIKGIADHLDYIAAMGYTMIWPTPLTESNQPSYSYHGYAATDTYKIDPRYGSNEDYRRMVAAAKQKGLGVIQDVVLNHIGSNHWWMKDMPMQDWLSFDGRFVPTRHTRNAVSDPYAAATDRENFTAGWFSQDMPDMNQANPLVAAYQIQNTIWWIEYAGLSGIRADTYGYSDAAFLARWSRRLTEEYPHLNIVGEEWSDNPVVVSYWQRGKQNRNGYVSYLPSLMDFPLHGVLRKALLGEDTLHSGLNDLYEALINDNLYPDPMSMVLFEGNHDVPRLYSVLGQDLDLTKMALAYVLTMPRIPQIYYGTEVLMTSPTQRDDGATRQDFPGGWPGDKINAFTGQGLSEQQKDAQAFLKHLLNWRKHQAVIQHGKLMHYAPENGSYVYFRYQGNKKVMVAFNKNHSTVTLERQRYAEMLPAETDGTEVLTGRRIHIGATLDLPARSVTIVELD